MKNLTFTPRHRIRTGNFTLREILSRDGFTEARSTVYKSLWSRQRRAEYCQWELLIFVIRLLWDAISGLLLYCDPLAPTCWKLNTGQ